VTGAPAADAPGEAAPRLALAAAALLAVFAVLFTAGSALGVWPQAPADAFAGWDLRVGTAAAVGLLASLLRR
jgi:hypothetical protein